MPLPPADGVQLVACDGKAVGLTFDSFFNRADPPCTDASIVPDNLLPLFHRSVLTDARSSRRDDTTQFPNVGCRSVFLLDRGGGLPCSVTGDDDSFWLGRTWEGDGGRHGERSLAGVRWLIREGVDVDGYLS